jgi:hypothetical protein
MVGYVLDAGNPKVVGERSRRSLHSDINWAAGEVQKRGRARDAHSVVLLRRSRGPDVPRREYVLSSEEGGEDPGAFPLYIDGWVLIWGLDWGACRSMWTLQWIRLALSMEAYLTCFRPCFRMFFLFVFPRLDWERRC